MEYNELLQRRSSALPKQELAIKAMKVAEDEACVG